MKCALVLGLLALGLAACSGPQRQRPTLEDATRFDATLGGLGERAKVVDRFVAKVGTTCPHCGASLSTGDFSKQDADTARITSELRHDFRRFAEAGGIRLQEIGAVDSKEKWIR